jgi:excisionase family DNA binding protein
MKDETLAVTLTIGQLRDLIAEGVAQALNRIEADKRPTPNGQSTCSVADAAKHTGLSRETLHALVRSGTLHNFGSRSRIRISWHQLEQYQK